MISLLKIKRPLSRFSPYLIILLATILSYVPTFTGEFILDDKPLIQQNPYITKLHSIQSYLIQEDGVPDKINAEDYHTSYYRPLLNLSYWLDYKVWGMWAPGFRTTNLILHILCSFVIYRFLLLLTNDRELSIWCTLIFAVHPVNTEAVSWVTSRNNILATLFALSAHSIYIKAQEKESKTPFLITSAVFYGCAVFSKEFGIMLLPILFLYKKLVRKTKTRLREDATEFIPFFLFLVLYFILRQKATSAWVVTEGLGNIWSRVYFTPYLIAANLKMILLPYNLHSFIIKYPEGYLNWQIGLGSSVVILLVCFVFRFRRNRLFVYSVLSFIVALFPILNVVPTSGISLFSMRWLYFPMVFLTPALATLLKSLLKEKKVLTIAVSASIVAYLGAYSFFLNRVLWHDEQTFFDVEIHEFNNTYYAYGCALNYLKVEEYQQADRYFRIAINGYHSKRPDTLIDYAALLIDMGRPKNALLQLKRASLLSMSPKTKGGWYTNMGTAYLHLKKEKEALPYLKLAVEYSPDESMNWANLGAVYGRLKRYEESVVALNRGLEIEFDSVQIRKNLAITYTEMGDYEKAYEVLSKIPFDEVEGKADIERLIKNVKKRLTENDF